MRSMEIPLFYFNLFSLVVGFAASLFFVWKKPKSILALTALAVVLFVLLGVFALPGFLLGLGAKALLSGAKGRKGWKKGKER